MTELDPQEKMLMLLSLILVKLGTNVTEIIEYERRWRATPPPPKNEA